MQPRPYRKKPPKAGLFTGKKMRLAPKPPAPRETEPKEKPTKD